MTKILKISLLLLHHSHKQKIQNKLKNYSGSIRGQLHVTENINYGNN